MLVTYRRYWQRLPPTSRYCWYVSGISRTYTLKSLTGVNQMVMTTVCACMYDLVTDWMGRTYF